VSRRKSQIVLPDERLQFGLFAGSSPDTSADYPPVHRTQRDYQRVVESADRVGLGLDLEFSTDTGRPSILGISTLREAASIPWDSRLAQWTIDEARKRDIKIVGYFSASADKKVMDGWGCASPLDLWEDGAITHYLNNQHLCKIANRDEDDDPGSLGFMNLWTATSLVADVQNWKSCWRQYCSGQYPCPTHDVFGYNGVDSWAGLKVHVENGAELDRMKVPVQFRREVLELSELCETMRERGMRVDTDRVRELDARISNIQDTLFPEVGRRFNPKSSKQVREWFAERGVRLANSRKDTLRDELLKIGKRHDIFDSKPVEVAEQLSEVTLTEVESGVVDLWKTKDGGKGIDSWFGEKHLSDEGAAGVYLHSRFNTTGSSLGRLSSSGPNAHNFQKYGLGKQARAAIIPRDPALKLIRADYKQLEARMIMYLAGFDIRDFPKDLFTWLVQNSDGKFDKAAELGGRKPRDMAKITSHGSNYGMGLKVLTSQDLDTSYVKQAINAGALRVHRDWEYAGGVVAFTGKHLANMLFGNESFDSRRLALEIQEDVYFAAYPQIRAWQRRVLAEFEARRYVKYPTGRFIRLIGPFREDNALTRAMEEDSKIVLAAYGQGVSADHVQAIMLRYKRELGAVPILQVHDELVNEIPREWTDKQAGEFISLMQQETWRLPGFSCPVDAGIGENWLDAMTNADKHPLVLN